MLISQIHTTQRSLKRIKQIPALISAILIGEEILPIVLIRAIDNEIEVQEGHHRLAAYYLSGRTILNKYEYILLEGNQIRPRTGNIERLINLCGGDLSAVGLAITQSTKKVLN